MTTSSRLPKSTCHTDRHQYFNMTLESKYATEILHLDRQMATALDRLFREKRTIEEELWQQRSARLSDPIPPRLLPDSKKPSDGTSVRRHDNLTKGTYGAVETGNRDEPQGRSAGDADSRTFPSVKNDGKRRAVEFSEDSNDFNYRQDLLSERSQEFSIDHSSHSYKSVDFSRDEKAQKTPQMRSWKPTVNFNHATNDEESMSFDRLVDSVRAVTIYVRLQHRVQESLEHGNKAKNSEAAVESTMKLMKRRQLRKMREAEKRSSRSRENRPHELSMRTPAEKKTYLPQKATDDGAPAKWSDRNRLSNMSPPRISFLSTEAYRLPSLDCDVGLGLSANREMKMETFPGGGLQKELHLKRAQQTAENEKLMRKLEDFYAKY